MEPTFELPLTDSWCAPPVLLVGLSNEGTWLQSERHSARFCGVVPHLLDFLCYATTGLNQGACGESAHTDKSPLRVRPDRGR